MTDLADCSEGDRHIPTFILDNFIGRMITPPEEKIRKYVSAGITVADVGCGPGHFTISMAEAVGPKGKVYAADSDPKFIEVLKARSRTSSMLLPDVP